MHLDNILLLAGAIKNKTYSKDLETSNHQCKITFTACVLSAGQAFVNQASCGSSYMCNGSLLSALTKYLININLEFR
jgi:hypothetical protein